MPDKFTRTGLNEGDTYFGTTANSAKSRESLEDNIDDKLMTFIGVDDTGGNISNSTTETKIGEVIIPANSARARFIIIAGIRIELGAASDTNTGTFRIRTGTSATATSNTQRKSLTLQVSTGTGSIGQDINGTIIMATIITTDEVFTGQIYVHITGKNSITNANAISRCDFVYVLGI